jgi:hypothetical protein
MRRVRTNAEDMITVHDLDELAGLIEHSPNQERLCVRCSAGLADETGDGNGGGASRDSLTRVRLPGRSANPVAVEPNSPR